MAAAAAAAAVAVAKAAAAVVVGVGSMVRMPCLLAVALETVVVVWRGAGLLVCG